MKCTPKSGLGGRGFFMSKVNEKLKLKIVLEYNEGYGSYFLANKYNISHSTINNWVYQYEREGIEGLRKSMTKTKYTGDFKLFVLNYRQIHKLSYNETAKHFNIKNNSTIANWQRQYDKLGFEGLSRKIGRPKKDTEMSSKTKKKKSRKLNKSELEELKELRKRNEYLEAEVLYLKEVQEMFQKKN